MEFLLFEKIILLILILLSIIIFLLQVRKIINNLRLGKYENRFDKAGKRLKRFLSQVIFQSKVISNRPIVGFSHALVFWGFLFFLLGTLNHFATGFGGTLFGYGLFNEIYSSILTIISILVLIGIISLAVRRYIIKSPWLTYPSPESGIIISLIGILMVTYLILRFYHNGTVLKTSWWIHSITILFFLDYIPMSKHLHLMVCPFNEFFKSFTLAEIRPLDLENLEKEDFGINLISDFSWKDILDGYACILCGRCTEQCPAYNSSKELNPREIVLSVKEAVRKRKIDKPLVENFIPAKVLWQCTTCGACESICPTGVEHLPKIIGLRRFQTAESKFPSEASTVFKNLEKNFNPWNYNPENRNDIIKKLNIPLYKKDETEYLLWMGCFSNYDQEYQKVLSALINVLFAAKVNFGVLEQEKCCGEPARRLGNEFLFQSLVAENIEVLNSLNVKKIITACPHGYRILKEEYKDFNGNFDVFHHSFFIYELIMNGKLKLKHNNEISAVYQDPCYLSRYANITAEPRKIITKTGINLKELKRTKNKSFCCGGGGGTFFLEETEGSRINH
ncbi:[Fe-S]-binding protein, partial [candidate division KSB1 bacterium]